MQQEKYTPAKAAKWFNARSWAGGLMLEAHKSTDVLEFSFQYAKNRESWDKALAWLRDSDLENIPPGKYKLDGDRVFVSVAEGNTKEFDDTRWEAHRKYIDIQYVAKGKERIGVAPLIKAISTEPFSTEKDVGFYEVPEADCRYYVAAPETFFVFFPQDAHRPCIRIKDTDTDKKIVIKIKVR